jgi:uncharacterized protein (TIGR02246 family)
MKTSLTILKSCLHLALFTLLSLNLLPAPVQANENTTQAENAIRKNVQSLEDGWNTKSGALFAKPFAEDADYVVINGRHLKGRTEIETGHQRIFDTIYKNTSIKLTVKQIRFLRADVALVHVNGHRESPDKELAGDAFLTCVMTKENGNWMIAAFQNTAVIGGK